MLDLREHDVVAPWPSQFSETFVAEARELLDARPVLLVVGPTGGSRNRLAATIADVPDGPVWSRHVARPGEHATPYFALEQVFRGVHPGRDASADRVETAARDHLAEIGGPPPTLIVANADLCDPESLEVLVRLATRRDITLIATTSPETASHQQRLLDVAAVIDLPPLTRETAGRLLAARFGVPAHPPLVDVLMQRSDGAYDVLCDIADAAVESGLFVDLEGVLVIDPDRPDAADDLLSSPVTARTADEAGGSADITSLVQLTSLLGRLAVDEARACVGEDAVESALARGALRLVDEALVFTSRAESLLVQRTLPLERRVELFEHFSSRLPATLRRPGVAVAAADWWLAAGRLLPADLARRAALEANLTGRYRRTLVYSEPERVEDGTTVAVLDRIFALVEVGDHVALREMYTAMDPTTLTEDELLPYFRWLHRLPDDATRAALTARAVTTDDAAASRRRAAVRTLSGLIDRAFLEAGDELAADLRSLAFASHLSPCNRAMAFTTLAAVLRHSGRPDQAVEAAEFALGLLDGQPEQPSAFHLDTAREYHVVALLAAVDLVGAAQALRAYSSGTFSQPGSGRFTTALASLLELIRGNAPQALANAQLCLAGLRRHDPRNVRGWLQAMLAMILVQCERPEESAQMLAESDDRATRRAPWDLERRTSQACVHDAFAEPEEALAILAEVVDEARRRGLRLAWIDAAVLSVQIGGPPHMPELMEAVDGLVDPTGAPAIWQAFARAAHAYDIEGLVALAEQLEVRGAIMYAAEVAQYVLDAARRAGDLTPETRERLLQLADHRRIKRAG